MTVEALEPAFAGAAIHDAPAVDDIAPAGGLPVTIEGVGKTFGTKEVLRGIDLSIDPGQFVAIVGRSGCGKSTLLRLLAGLDTPTSGSIRLGGEPLNGLNRQARIMFQEARLLPWRRVLGNVGVGLGGDWRAQAAAALKAVGLEDRAREWPAVLSGGQRQRVALARALVRRPRLLMLDEPLGALDALTRIAMQHLIERVWRAQGFTAVLVTHDVAEAVALADRVVMIEEGEITLDLAVDLPRPRPRGNPDFAALEGRILNTLFKDYELAGSGI
ncbi:ATP-binding cassette domain-containing protein [Azospirillum sp.]|uniref:ATP-binding cassette domain-containing protein n=1 Tax=Azospirillum sp. TaxID=34012 RepID=UPI002D52B12D|nr:ATP-binding cassette domain-containing protein [Azospirillum sp.]HYD66203.1 ATP-binding cassette domain-containing protein [Azospirillum sp.]